MEKSELIKSFHSFSLSLFIFGYRKMFDYDDFTIQPPNFSVLVNRVLFSGHVIVEKVSYHPLHIIQFFFFFNYMLRRYTYIL